MELSPGELCPECGNGALWAYCSAVKESEDRAFRIRYYQCNSCGWKPSDNKVVSYLEDAPRQINMRRPSTKLGRGRRKG